MNKRQVLVLWIIALILGGGAYLAWSKKANSFESKTKRNRGEKLVADFQVDPIAKITISGAKDSTSLVRKDKKWIVENRGSYPAQAAEVNQFLEKLAEVEVTQGIEADATFAPRFGMDPNGKEDKDRGVNVVMFNEAGAEIGNFTFGKNMESAGDPASMMGGGGINGRFVRNNGDSSGVYVTKEIFPSLTPEAKSWLERKFFTLEKPLSISVSAPAKPDEVAWKVARPDDSAEFTLDGAKPEEALDATVASTLKTVFAYGQFEDVVTAETAAQTGEQASKRTVKIDTAEGFHYTVTLMPTIPAPVKEGETTPLGVNEIILTVDVTADIPAERKKEANEAEADAKAKDTAFTERKAALEKKLAEEKAFAGRFFKVSRESVENLLKDRAGLIKQPEAPSAAGPGGAAPRMPQGFPGMPNSGAGPIAAPQRPTPPRRPVEATTPPIAIPPLPEGDKPEEVKPEEPKPEEMKPEELKQPEEVKPAEPKLEEVKPEEPKVEQPKLEEPKPEPPQPAEPPQPEQPKVEGQ